MTPYERGYAAGQEEMRRRAAETCKKMAKVFATTDRYAVLSGAADACGSAILSLPIEGEAQPTHTSAKPFKCPHCGSHYFGPTWRGKEIAGRYCKGWPSGHDRSYNPCPAKHVEWYEQADQRGTAALQEVQRQAPGQTREEQPGTAGRGVGIGGGVAPAVTAQSDPKAPVSQSVPHPNPGERVPLCAGCAQAWFTERNLLTGSHECVVCAFLGNKAARPGPSQECVSDLSERLRQYADIADAGGKAHWANAMREAMYTLAVYRQNAAKEEHDAHR